MTNPAQPAHRITDIVLAPDNDNSLTLGSDLKRERQRALTDLLVENTFQPVTDGMTGPYAVQLSLAAGCLNWRVLCTESGKREAWETDTTPLAPVFRDYALICDNFYKAAREGQMHRFEALDAGRSCIHNDGADILASMLKNKVVLDKTTARRLFTLTYVLHMRTVNYL